MTIDKIVTAGGDIIEVVMRLATVDDPPVPPAANEGVMFCKLVGGKVTPMFGAPGVPAKEMPTAESAAAFAWHVS